MKLQFESFQFQALKPGPRLLVTGAVHGNETCGTNAIRRMLSEFAAGERVLSAGAVTFVPVTNPLAYANGTRMGDRNLNRNLYPKAVATDFEDHVANWLCPLLAAHDVLLDLHSFHTGGQPFVMLGPTDNAGELEPFSSATQEEAFARALGVGRFVEGWLETYARGVERRRRSASAESLALDARYGVGTTEYMRSVGGYGVTLECGQHEDPAAVEVAYCAIARALVHLGLLEGAPPSAVVPETLRLFDVVDCEQPGDCFVREWASFDPLEEGSCIGYRADGRPVLAPEAGFIVFPNPGAQPGQEWFYLARRSRR